MIPVLPAAHSKRPRSTPPGALGVGGGATLRAIDHANLWHELAWEPEQAAAGCAARCGAGHGRVGAAGAGVGGGATDGSIPNNANDTDI